LHSSVIAPTIRPIRADRQSFPSRRSDRFDGPADRREINRQHLQSTIVVNKNGGGAIGLKAVKDAPADGYTLLITPPPLVLIPLVRKNIGFALSDFTPVNLIGNTPSALIVKADAAWQSVEQPVADAKKKPAAITLIEKGYPSIEASPWFVFFVRTETPREITNKLARAIREAVQDKDITAKIEKGSVEIENRGPEETAKILATFNQKWTDVAKSAKIVAE